MGSRFPKGDGIKYPVKIQTDINDIVGDFEITNLDVWAQYGGARVTEVPGGAEFELHADYNIKNHNPGFTDLWSTSFTVYDVTHRDPIDSDDWGDHVGGGLLTGHDAVNVTMPEEGTEFRCKVFANQAHGAGSPPTSRW